MASLVGTRGLERLCNQTYNYKDVQCTVGTLCLVWFMLLGVRD